MKWTTRYLGVRSGGRQSLRCSPRPHFQGAVLRLRSLSRPLFADGASCPCHARPSFGRRPRHHLRGRRQPGKRWHRGVGARCHRAKGFSGIKKNFAARKQKTHKFLRNEFSDLFPRSLRGWFGTIAGATLRDKGSIGNRCGALAGGTTRHCGMRKSSGGGGDRSDDGLGWTKI